MKGYIYAIKNKINDKVYIGITENIQQRKTRHLNNLKHRQHSSPGLQNAYDLYGEENFYFEVTEVEIEDRQALCQLEIDTISQYDSFQNGYNGTIGGDDPPNHKKYKDDDMLDCLCIVNRYDNIGKTLEEVFHYSKGTISLLKLRKGYESIWVIYDQLTPEARMARAEEAYIRLDLKTQYINRQLAQGGCSNAYQLTQTDYNLAFTLKDYNYNYTQVANILSVKPATVKDWFNGRSRKKEHQIFLQLSPEEKYQIYCRFQIAELSGNPTS